ncbi:MAG: carboxymuconolactone decarboxylase family protein [Acidimicrobiia bacterium]|nr:carboxymuconolactone decarboxylase family protein [Acidimicrobiia bacterium]
MPRLRQVPRAEAAPSVLPLYDLVFGPDRDPVAEPGTASGTSGDWWTVLAGNPEVFDHCVGGFLLYRSSEAYLDPRLRELGQCRAGFARGSTFVFSQHCKAMRTAGFTEAQIEAVPHWSVADCWTPLERAVLAYTDCLVLDGGRVPEPVFEALRSGLDDRAILGLTYITMTYELHATMARALRLELDDRDDPVVEVGEKRGLQ